MKLLEDGQIDLLRYLYNKKVIITIKRDAKAHR